MAVVPDKIAEKLSYFEQHLPVWAANTTTIGITSLQISDLAILVADARANFDSAIDARSVSRAATVAQNASIDAMVELGGDLIKTIRAFAETTNDITVFETAQVPPPSPPTPAGPPEQPTNLAAKLLTPFGLTISWNGSAAQGTYFNIWRKLNAETVFSFVGTTKTKSLDDTSIPDGTTSANYYISAHRDEQTVNSAIMTLQFGSGGGAGLTLAA
jgi:hypothetical protein